MDHIESSMIVALIGFLGVVIGARITAKIGRASCRERVLDLV